MTAPEKAKLLGLFYWLFTAFNVVIIAVIGIIYIAIFGVVFSNVPHKAGEPPPELFITIIIAVFAFIFVFTLLFSIPKIIAGYGLRTGKPWARLWAIIASVMCCLSFPIGTAIGVFGLVFIFSDEGKKYFDDQSRGYIGSPINAPPPNSWQ